MKKFTLRLPPSSHERGINATAQSGTRCKLCDIEDWTDPAFQSLAGEILNGDPNHYFPHRKLWEFTAAVQSMKSLGVWNDEALGISVAGGSERFLFYSANHVQRIVAADIYGEGDFSNGEATAKFFHDPDSAAPYAYRKDHLKVVRMNALDLHFPDDTFDFAVSFSSIEHFGGLNNAIHAIKEMGRIVRPGGVVFVTTDCSLNHLCTNEVFTPRELSRLCTASSLTLVDDISYHLSQASLNHLLDMRCDKLDVVPHINLKLFGSVFTSISITLQKPGKSGGRSPLAERVAALDRQCTQLREDHHPKLTANTSAISKTVERIARKCRGVRYRIEELFI